MKTRRVSRSSRVDPVVMDILPWPGGYGFSGGDTWWRQVSGQTERERLDNLIGLALLDDKAREQLVTKRDPALLATFGLSEQTQDWLRSIDASTLEGLAQAILAATQRTAPTQKPTETRCPRSDTSAGELK